MAVKVNLRSGAVLDGETVTVEKHVVKILDRNGDEMNTVGQPLVESVEAI